MSILSDLLAGAFIIALIYVLVRPGSQGTAFVTAFGDLMSGLIGQATDLAGSASNDRSGTTTNGN